MRPSSCPSKLSYLLKNIYILIHSVNIYRLSMLWRAEWTGKEGKQPSLSLLFHPLEFTMFFKCGFSNNSSIWGQRKIFPGKSLITTVITTSALYCAYDPPLLPSETLLSVGKWEAVQLVCWRFLHGWISFGKVTGWLH